MIGDPAERVGEPRLRVEIVQLCRGDQGVHGGGALATAVGTREEPVLASDGNALCRQANYADPTAPPSAAI